MDGNEFPIKITMLDEVTPPTDLMNDVEKTCTSDNLFQEPTSSENTGILLPETPKNKDSNNDTSMKEVSSVERTIDVNNIQNSSPSSANKRVFSKTKNTKSFSRKNRLEMAVKKLRMTQESMQTSEKTNNVDEDDAKQSNNKCSLLNEIVVPSKSLINEKAVPNKSLPDQTDPNDNKIKINTHLEHIPANSLTVSSILNNHITTPALSANTNFDKPSIPSLTNNSFISQAASQILENFSKQNANNPFAANKMIHTDSFPGQPGLLPNFLPTLPSDDDLIFKAATGLLETFNAPVLATDTGHNPLVNLTTQSVKSIDMTKKQPILKKTGHKLLKQTLETNFNKFKREPGVGETSNLNIDLLLAQGTKQVVRNDTHSSGDDKKANRKKVMTLEDEEKLMNFLSLSTAFDCEKSPTMVLGGENGASFNTVKRSILDKYKNMAIKTSKDSEAPEKGNMEGENSENSKEKPYVCPMCGKSYLYSTPFTSHLARHMEPNGHSCKYCGKTFNFQSHLMRHLRVHTGEKPFTCVICDKDFTDQGHLKSHLKAHRGERSFACPECGKRFLKQSDVNRHMRVHTGEKPYCCMTCGKFFSRQTNLQSHMRTHTGERPYECDICGNAFGRKDTLLQHKVMHTGDKQFACEECGKRFVKRSDVTRHMRTHERHRHKCLACGKRIPKNKNDDPNRRPPAICDACARTFTTASAVMNESLLTGSGISDETAASLPFNPIALGLTLNSNLSLTPLPGMPSVPGMDMDWIKNAVTELQEKATPTSDTTIDQNNSLITKPSDSANDVTKSNDISIAKQTMNFNKDITPMRGKSEINSDGNESNTRLLSKSSQMNSSNLEAVEAVTSRDKQTSKENKLKSLSIEQDFLDAPKSKISNSKDATRIFSPTAESLAKNDGAGNPYIHKEQHQTTDNSMNDGS